MTLQLLSLGPLLTFTNLIYTVRGRSGMMLLGTCGLANATLTVRYVVYMGLGPPVMEGLTKYLTIAPAPLSVATCAFVRVRCVEGIACFVYTLN